MSSIQLLTSVFFSLLRRFRDLLIAALAVILIFPSAGCGPLKSARHEEAAADDSAASHSGASPGEAEALNIRIVPAGLDAHLPNPAVNLSGERVSDRAIFSSDRMILKDNLFLSDAAGGAEKSKALFFVWSEDFLGSKIQSATVDYRLTNEKNQETGRVERLDAHYEPLTHRWYVLISDCFKDAASEVDPSRQQELSFDLTSADGSRHLIHVTFRAVGPLPFLTVLENPAPVPSIAANGYLETARSWGKDGVLLRTSVISNPTHRDFRIAIRPGAAGGMTARFSLGTQTWGEYPCTYPTAVPISWQSIRVPMSLAFMRVSRGHSEPRKIELAQGAPQAELSASPHSGASTETRTVMLKIAAGEELKIEWWARAINLEKHCALPAPEVQTIRWWHCPSLYNFQHNLYDPYIDYYEKFEHTWKSGGAALTGNWSALVSITHPFADPRQGVEATSLILKPMVQVESLVMGDVPESAPEFSCQGLL